jgi:hypothetical protein
MSVDSKRVRGRRKLRYSSFQAVVDDAHRMAAVPHRQLGNWSLAQILKHLGTAIHGSIDGPGFRVRWYYRWFGPIVVKPFLVKGPFPAGFRLPRSGADRLVAKDTTTYEEGISELLAGIERLGWEQKRIPHPVAGKLSVEEWNQLHLRHAELHMSFIVPEEDVVLSRNTKS